MLAFDQLFWLILLPLPLVMTRLWPAYRERLVTVNVAAIAPTVFEREFFGHVRGAFSGADRDKSNEAAGEDSEEELDDSVGIGGGAVGPLFVGLALWLRRRKK